MENNSDEFPVVTDSCAVSCLSGGAVSCHHFLIFFHKFGLIHSTIHKCEVVIIAHKVAKQ